VTSKNFPLILNTSWFKLSLVKEIINMKKLNVTLAILVAAVMAGNAQVSSEPVGYVNLTITGSGTGLSKKTTYLSFPLLDKQLTVSGKTTGTITGVTSTTITDSTAGWTAGELSTPASPCLIGITSGTAAGRIFLISSSATTGGALGTSANTATTVTITTYDTASGIDLVAAGVAAGDSYSIYGGDTLSSLLGSPSTTGVLSGATASVADSVVVVVNGSSSTYWHNGTNWKKSASGSPDSFNVPILPYSGISYARLGASNINITATGTVPTGPRKMQIKNSGPTYFGVYFPADTTLSTLGLHNMSGWTANASVGLADKVVLVSNTGSSSTYWYTGTNWKKSASGSPLSDTVAIPAGTMVYINKIGTTTGYSTFTQALPYTL
jgi:hypothetical protein